MLDNIKFTCIDCFSYALQSVRFCQSAVEEGHKGADNFCWFLDPDKKKHTRIDAYAFFRSGFFIQPYIMFQNSFLPLEYCTYSYYSYISYLSNGYVHGIKFWDSEGFLMESNYCTIVYNQLIDVMKRLDALESECKKCYKEIKKP